MGTKNNPGKFDCYANAEPDEPMFVLLGRDPTAAFVVTFWRFLKEEMRKDGQSEISDAKLGEAEACAAQLTFWALRQGKDPAKLNEAMTRAVFRMSKVMLTTGEATVEEIVDKAKGG